MKITGFNIKIFNPSTSTWEKLTHDIESVLYLIVFKPQIDIYEKRRPKTDPGRIHTIDGGEIVLKFGKAEGSLLGRYEGSYCKHWKYHYESYHPGGNRTHSDCFAEVTDIYIMYQQKTLDKEFLKEAENNLKQCLQNNIDVSRQERGSKSEYRLLNNNNDYTIANITSIKTSFEEWLENQ